VVHTYSQQSLYDIHLVYKGLQNFPSFFPFHLKPYNYQYFIYFIPSTSSYLNYNVRMYNDITNKFMLVKFPFLMCKGECVIRREHNKWRFYCINGMLLITTTTCFGHQMAIVRFLQVWREKVSDMLHLLWCWDLRPSLAFDWHKKLKRKLSHIHPCTLWVVHNGAVTPQKKIPFLTLGYQKKGNILYDR
jgi:hypothetical protein